MNDKIAIALERIATCLEKIQKAQEEQIQKVQNAPQEITKVLEQLKKSLGVSNHGN